MNRVLVLIVAFGLAGCTGTAASTAPTVAPPASPGTGSSPSPSPRGPLTPSPATLPTTTETAWGRIWDDLPARFPHYAKAQPADSGMGPASAVLSVPAKGATVVAWYRSALTTAGDRVSAVNGPLEDGSTVIDLTGPDPGCRIQLTIVPQGTRSEVTILFGAACPFS